MLLYRRILLAVTVLLVLGSLTSSLGYALYIRSDAYCASVARDVGQFMGLPTDIAGVEVLSSRSRGFLDIDMWMPGRTVQIFGCDRTIWSAVDREGEQRNALDVYDGWLLLGTGEFSRDDYRQILHSGLGHDFSTLNLAAVNFHDIDILWRQPDLKMQIHAASGDISFQTDGTGHANLVSHRINGTPVAEPIAIRATFTPGVELTFRHVALDVPRIPLRALGLDAVLGAPVRSGWFDGTVAFRPEGADNVYTLRGAVGDARLEDFTRRLAIGPVHGRVDINLNRANLAPGRLIALVFEGRLSDVQLGTLAAALGEPAIDGRLNLRVNQCRYANQRLEHLSVAGSVVDAPMSAVTALIGRGTITGNLKVTVNSILIEDDVLRWADVDIEVAPPAQSPGTIDRTLIAELARAALGVDLGAMADYLPDNVEYARLGCKLLVDGDRLHIKGTHGAAGDTVLTVKVLGRELGVLKAPSRTYPVSSLIDAAREHVADYDVRQYLRNLVEGRTEQQEDL